jgi:hypothetical protein
MVQKIVAEVFFFFFANDLYKERLPNYKVSWRRNLSDIFICFSLTRTNIEGSSVTLIHIDLLFIIKINKRGIYNKSTLLFVTIVT